MPDLFVLYLSHIRKFAWHQFYNVSDGLVAKETLFYFSEYDSDYDFNVAWRSNVH